MGKLKCSLPRERYMHQFLIKFLANSPATYYLDGTKQCKANAWRSLEDLVQICKYHYSSATPKTVAKALKRAVKLSNNIGARQCPDIKKIVWCSNYFYGSYFEKLDGYPFVFDINRDGKYAALCNDRNSVGKYTIDDIKKLMNE